MTDRIVLRSRPRLRPWLILPVLSVAILCLGWTTLWLFASVEAAKSMDAWITREAEKEHVWTCPGRKVTGFPLQIDVSCAQPTFSGRVGGAMLEGKVVALRAEVPLYRPNAIAIVAEGPLQLRRPEGGEAATVSWTAAALSLRILGADRARAALILDGPAFESGEANAKAQGLEIRYRPPRRAGAPRSRPMKSG